MVKQTTWKSNLPRVERVIDNVTSDVLKQVADIAFESIVYGSPEITGTVGQPADLRKPGKWERVEESPNAIVIGSSDKSARSVEDGVSYKHGGRAIKRLKSSVGGFHSVALTELAAPRIIAQAVELAKVENV